MEIEGYKYITHKIIPRLWGVECRFTVARLIDDSHINDIVMIPNEKVDEKEIGFFILERLKLIDHPINVIIPERIYAEKEIEALLVEKGYLTIDQKIEELKTLAELIAKSGVK